MSKADSLIRAAKLFCAVADYANEKGHQSSQADFAAGLSAEMFNPFLGVLGVEREVSSWYLCGLGKMVGGRELFVHMKKNDLVVDLDKQKIAYVEQVTSFLSAIADECMHAPHDDSMDVSVDAVPQSQSSLLQTASTLGYIPTVANIDDMPQLNVGDEQLGRVLSGLASFLSTDMNRVHFCKVDHATIALATLLDKDVGVPVQVYYQVVFCLWLLSFMGHKASSGAPDDGITDLVSNALEKAGVPRRLTTVLREMTSEKIVRISLATLRNILSLSSELRKEMVGAGLVDALQSPSFRRLDDDDMRDDLGVLADALESELASMSSFDVYKAEVLSGALEWTPAHRDEQFWRENVEKLERNQQEILRCMVRLLHESSDETVLAVACNDLAQFVKFHPRGRSIAQSLGVKARLMELMVSGEGEVRRYALNCVQVLMIRWNRQS